MPFVEVSGVRTDSDSPVLGTKWHPIDLMCRNDLTGTDEIVRTKLQRGEPSAAMCFAEAASHCVLELLGHPVAEARVVTIDAELADGITARFSLEQAVVPGRHWGTVFIDDSYGPSPDSLVEAELLDPLALFNLFLADVVLANGDRLTEGNVLLRMPDRTKKYEVIPIDQSEAFATEGCLRRVGCLQGCQDSLLAAPIPLAETIAVGAAPNKIKQMFGAIAKVAPDLRDAVNQVPGEWIDRGKVDADGAQDFIEYRAANISQIADMNGWLERIALVEHQGALQLQLEEGGEDGQK